MKVERKRRDKKGTREETENETTKKKPIYAIDEYVVAAFSHRILCMYRYMYTCTMCTVQRTTALVTFVSCKRTCPYTWHTNIPLQKAFAWGSQRTAYTYVYMLLAVTRVLPSYIYVLVYIEIRVPGQPRRFRQGPSPHPSKQLPGPSPIVRVLCILLTAKNSRRWKEDVQYDVTYSMQGSR